MLSIAVAAVALVVPALSTPLISPFEPLGIFKRISSGCSDTGTASCHNTTVERDTCCFEANGQLLQVQFWDTDPPTGPSNSWTIHGLWPDHCDGSFSENCDSSRDYTDITQLLEQQGATSTLDFMQQFWLSDDESPEDFWEHEWATHGTCYTTLEPSCLPSGSPKGAEAVAFFQTVVKLFQSLPTFTWLENAGITPTSSKTFTLSQLTSALKSASGVTPALDCTDNAVSQISWYFNVKGSVIDGTFVPIDAPEAGSCPSSGIKYPPKSGSPASTSAGSAPTSTGTSGALPAEATLTAVTSSGSTTGGLLSGGTWSTQTLATYHFSGSTDSFTMTTSKGNCAVSGGELTCGSSVSAGTFSAVSSGGNMLLASGGSTSFSSDTTPSGTAQETVFTGSGHSKTYSIVINSK